MPTDQSPSLAYEEFQHRFFSLLGQLVQAHASFDFNVGLQLHYQGEERGVDVEHLLSAKVPFSRRWSELKKLVLASYEPAGIAARARFVALFAKADRLKSLRNDYVHGRWGVPGRVVEGKYLVGYCPLHWDMAPSSTEKSEYLTLEAFEENVTEMKSLAGEFYDLIKAYVGNSPPHQ